MQSDKQSVSFTGENYLDPKFIPFDKGNGANQVGFAQYQTTRWRLSENSSSIGVVIRDSFGHVVAAHNRPLHVCFAVEISKVLALEQGVLLAQELQLSKIILESDSLNVIQAIHDKATGSSYGHIVHGILQASESFESCIFKHFSRNFNIVAHELTQLARRSGTQHLWFGIMPPCVSSLIQADML